MNPNIKMGSNGIAARNLNPKTATKSATQMATIVERILLFILEGFGLQQVKNGLGGKGAALIVSESFVDFLNQQFTILFKLVISQFQRFVFHALIKTKTWETVKLFRKIHDSEIRRPA